VFTFNNGIYHVHLEIQPYYFPFNSGWYNVQKVWDIANCFISVAGVPIDAGVFFSIEYVPGGAGLVQAARLFAPYGTFQNRALPQPPADWWWTPPNL